MPACHAGGRGFEPLPGRQLAQIAQLVEQRTENPRVAGSIPALGTKKFCGFNSAVECHLAKVKVASSNLVTRSKNSLDEQLKVRPDLTFSSKSSLI